ncbi:hypothetical protein LINPERPRIM_LOCUS2311, partial [Linum perenne]
INKALAGPTSISPVVTRFLCPPEIPLIISSPTKVSAQTSSPNIIMKDLNFLANIVKLFTNLHEDINIRIRLNVCCLFSSRQLCQHICKFPHIFA